MQAILRVFMEFFIIVIVCLVAILATMRIEEQKKTDALDSPPLGQISSMIMWPEGNNDIDMWLMGPDQDKAVGYSNKSGMTWDLLRDDMGNANDKFPANIENGSVRNIIPGEYTINVHYYRSEKGEPVTVNLELVVWKGDVKQVYTKEIVLYKEGQEITAINFRIDENYQVQDVNQVYIPLREDTRVAE